MLSTSVDFFGEEFSSDPTLLKLREFPVDKHHFCAMMRACLTTVIEVIE